MWLVIMRSLLFVKMSPGTYSLYSASRQLEGIQDGHFIYLHSRLSWALYTIIIY